MVDSSGPGAIFRIAATPARLVGRYRPDLAAAVDADALTYAGGRQAAFSLLLLVAVGYPLLASLLHAIVVEPPVDVIDLFSWAINPIFYLAYSESLPFLIAILAVGVFSPALGVLVVLVFAPADMVATVVSQATPNQFEPPLTAFLARIISYVVLWIGVVEVPLRGRRWVAAWGSSRNSASPTTFAAAYAVGIAVLVFFWGTALWWLIQPVVSWTYSPLSGWRQFTATWSFGWMLALAVGALAYAAAALRPQAAWHIEAEPDPQADRPAGIGRQFLRVGVLAALLSGLIWDWTEAILIIGGLVVAGPVLSLVLPRIPLPASMARIPSSVRWVVAMVVAAGATFLVLTSELQLGLQEDYILLAALLAVLAPVFRLIVDLGVGSQSQPAATVEP